MKPTPAGKYRQRIIIQENQFHPDESGNWQRDQYGAPLENWVDIWNCWASIEPLSGKEYFAGQQTQAEVSTRFRIRYPRLQVFKIWPGMRVKYLDTVHKFFRYFDIVSVIDQNEMHIELWLMAIEYIKPKTVAAGASSVVPSS